MNAIEKRILGRFKRLLLRRVALHRLVLFGSRARGDADPDSDMDVLVVVEGAADEATRDYVGDCAWEAGYREGMVIVPVVFSREEWENGPERNSLLAQAVALEGVPV
ncbi:MAG: nucleotidyltransferase domain-containing protein [Planctomycetes bacterium]|nr:nucleotidyltransferase domain-containing protein [Planctomycetota bacterium]